LFCGSQKIGKSWLMLKLCLCVSQGIPLWDMPTMEGDVLYLCLEDTFCRIQDRLFRLTDEASGRLHFAVASCKLSDGLIVQLEDYLKDYPDSRRSEEHTSELQSRFDLVCRLLLEKKKKKDNIDVPTDHESRQGL